jgi:hypothetical protein
MELSLNQHTTAVGSAGWKTRRTTRSIAIYDRRLGRSRESLRSSVTCRGIFKQPTFRFACCLRFCVITLIIFLPHSDSLHSTARFAVFVDLDCLLYSITSLASNTSAAGSPSSLDHLPSALDYLACFDSILATSRDPFALLFSSLSPAQHFSPRTRTTTTPTPMAFPWPIPERCSQCARQGTKPCGRCWNAPPYAGHDNKPTHYCSQVCYTAHSPVHSPECGKLQDRKTIARATELLYGILYRILLRAATTEIRNIETKGADVILYSFGAPRKLNQFRLPTKVDRVSFDASLMFRSSLKSMVFLPGFMRLFFQCK